ncbi:CheR family methyltransferase [Tsukamurella paurometabola]|uniref:Chemotaxis protein methyltransferase n=1 Tax=Tsukamurella paurometabola TaxID=2061 RepID=A0A3P8MD86_TSUPA|nr:CheR family methyltransferase [Tsukamurella paurometabola]UEA83001.1 methyltransferase [Tsukamurella paurometabola]VDR40086.1 Chemotaxis protein methyltransferase [Tsukamurella paurometabola]
MTIVTGWFRLHRDLEYAAHTLATLDRPASVWCAACGTGEEAYSMAIVLERAGIPGTVHGTDINRQHIRAATQAAYTSRSINDTEDPDLHRWLIGHKNRWHPRTAIRDRVTFAVSALGTDDPAPGRYDVVLARNVWRHLTPDAQQRAAHTIADSLTPNGLLLLGGADLLDRNLHPITPAGIPDLFTDKRVPGDTILTPRPEKSDHPTA